MKKLLAILAVTLILLLMGLSGCVTPPRPETTPPPPTAKPTATVAPSPVPPPQLQLAFAGNRNGQYALFLINIDGSSEKQITSASGYIHPSWSPDGKLIAAQKGDYEIVIMNPDGTNIKALTPSDARQSIISPDFSPHGNLVIVEVGTFSETRVPAIRLPTGIVALNLGGVASGISISGNVGCNFVGHPRLSPDASLIAFDASCPDMSTVTPTPTPTPSPGSSRNLPTLQTRPPLDNPVYNPIVKTVNRIAVVNFDGTKLTQLTTGKGEYDDTHPSWSPDGKRIVFVSNRTGKNQIYIMNVDGSGQTQITNDAFVNHDPAWSPDGIYIAFVSDHFGISELSIIRPDGTQRKRINKVAEQILTPAWRPFPGKGLGGLQPPDISPPSPSPTTPPPPVKTTPPPQTPVSTTGQLFISVSGTNWNYSIYVNGALVGQNSTNLNLPPGSYRVTIYNRNGTVVYDQMSTVIAGKTSQVKVSGAG